MAENEKGDSGEKANENETEGEQAVVWATKR